jgi:hypothetical protein
MEGDWKVAKDVLKKISTKQKRAGAAFVRKAAETYADMLRANIEGGGKVQPISPETKRKREFGKKRGFRTAIPRYSGATPLLRSRRYLESIVVRRSGRGQFATRIKPGARGDQLQDLEKLAVLLEEGATITVKMTRRMLAFLRLMFQNAVSKGVRPLGVREGGEVVGDILIRVPGRPIWQLTYQEFLKDGDKQTVAEDLRAMGRTLKTFSG